MLSTLNVFVECIHITLQILAAELVRVVSNLLFDKMSRQIKVWGCFKKIFIMLHKHDIITVIAIYECY